MRRRRRDDGSSDSEDHDENDNIADNLGGEPAAEDGMSAVLPLDPTRELNSTANAIERKSALFASELAMLKGFIQTASVEAKKFDAAARRNRAMNNNTNIALGVILVFTAGGGLLYNIFTLAVTDPNFGYNVINMLLTVLAAFLQIFQSVRNYSEKASNYQLAADQYTNYAREWRMCIARGVDDRREQASAAMLMAENRLSEIESIALPL